MWVLSRAKHFGLQVRLTVISDIRIVLILMMEKLLEIINNIVLFANSNAKILVKVCFVVDSRGKNQNSNWMVSLAETPKYKEART